MHATPARVKKAKCADAAADVANVGGTDCRDRECSCRECLRDVLGDKTFERAEASARSAPPPSPLLVERVRRIFASAEARTEAQKSAGTYRPTSCPRPNCECGMSSGA